MRETATAAVIGAAITPPERLRKKQKFSKFSQKNIDQMHFSFVIKVKGKKTKQNEGEITMKKLIFGLGVFFTSIFGIIGSMGVEILEKILLVLQGRSLISAMYMSNDYRLVFLITAAIGFIFALIGAFTREKSNK